MSALYLCMLQYWLLMCGAVADFGFKVSLCPALCMHTASQQMAEEDRQEFLLLVILTVLGCTLFRI